MSKRNRIVATVLLWSGAALLGFGVLLVIPQLIPLVESSTYTDRIPTAPPLAVTVTQVTDEPQVLLPFASGDAGGDAAPAASVPAASVPAASASTATPTLAATPTLPPADTPAATQGQVASTPRPTATPTLTPTPWPTPTPTPVWTGTAPVNVSIPSINLDAPVVPIGIKTVIVGGKPQQMWDVPGWKAAGWHDTSVSIGVPGNTVLNGHNTSRGEVFRDLYKTEIGAQIFIEGADGKVYVYRVAEKYILREAGQPLSVRLENARYIEPTTDERLTMVTCHPYGSLANRLIVIAYPVEGTGGSEGGAS